MHNTDCFAECIGKLPGGASLPFSFLPAFSVELTLNSLSAIKADYKIYVCKFSKNIYTKLYHIQNSKTKGQIV